MGKSSKTKTEVPNLVSGAGITQGNKKSGSPLKLRSLDQPYESFTQTPSEIVIGLVGPLGTNNDKVRRMIADRLRVFDYNTEVIPISTTIIPALAGSDNVPTLEPRFEYAMEMIRLGNEIRRTTKNKAVLAIAASAEISRLRPAGEVKKRAYIISSLKNQQEVEELRKIYGHGFYLFAIYTDRDSRSEYLMAQGHGMTRDCAWKLILTDEDESNNEYGQHTGDTFHLADFFLADEKNDDKLRHGVCRCIDLIFSNPLITPTFNEFSMFMAFASSLRSADLARQVGAVITVGHEILSTGANDCPSAGGGLYWPEFIGDRVDDHPRGRDYKRGFDSNSAEKQSIIEKIAREFPETERPRVMAILAASPIKDITEYGRVVHAEMEALLSCARRMFQQ